MAPDLSKITITKSSLYFRECKACGCVTLHIGKTTPEMPAGSTYNDCLQCLVDAHSVPGLSRWHDSKTGEPLKDPRGAVIQRTIDAKIQNTENCLLKSGSSSSFGLM